MTHEKLLANIDKQDHAIRIGGIGSEIEVLRLMGFRKALRAVVELHKPFMYEGRMGKFERCSGCSSEEEWLGEIYPCPTIQAIEKELQ